MFFTNSRLLEKKPSRFFYNWSLNPEYSFTFLFIVSCQYWVYIFVLLYFQ